MPACAARGPRRPLTRGGGAAQVTLLLSESDFEALDEEAQTQPTAAVDIDLGLNAYGNAQFYYTSKKKMAHKVDKTVQAADKAIKGATRKAKEDLKRTEIKARPPPPPTY